MTLAFWILAPLAVLSGLGVITARKAVHSALFLAATMVNLAIMYAMLEAPFLFAAQIIVYTGAIIMLFVFVLMLVGVDASDSLVETIRGHRGMAIVVGLVFALLVLINAGRLSLGDPAGLPNATTDGNVPAIAEVLFSTYLIPFEAAGILLIVATIGAMVLAHRERLVPKPTQKDLSEKRFVDYAEEGTHPGAGPPPGTFARHNAIGTPALLPDGRPAESSVSRVLVARGVVTETATLAAEAEQVGASGIVDEQSGAPGEPGENGAPSDNGVRRENGDA